MLGKVGVFSTITVGAFSLDIHSCSGFEAFSLAVDFLVTMLTSNIFICQHDFVALIKKRK